MNLPEVVALMESGTMSTCISRLETHCLIKDMTETIKQYEPRLHDVNDPVKRRDKIVYNYDTEGNVTDIKGLVKVNRQSLAFQKKIVLTAAAFLGTPAIEATPLDTPQEAMLSGLHRVWDSNKLDYSFKKIAKRTMSQRQCAELWSVIPAGEGYWDGTGTSSKFSLSMQLLSYSHGDTLYPVFDEFENMVAFGRGYKSKNKEGEAVQHLDIYTADQIYYSKESKGGWLFGTPTDLGIVYTEGFKSVENTIGKIPIVYYWQPLTEWDDVQSLIDRLELIYSKHGDTNDYSGSPIVVITGDVASMPGKHDDGKTIKISEPTGKVEYLTFNGAPESVKMEMDNLRRDIFNLTHTPDISFENMKGLGVLSGVAIKMLFLDAHLKAADREEIFGEGLQRRINYIKTALAVFDPSLNSALNMKIKPKFTYYLPENIAEDLANINTAVAGGFMSVETGTRRAAATLDYDGDEEVERVKAEKAAIPPPTK